MDMTCSDHISETHTSLLFKTNKYITPKRENDGLNKSFKDTDIKSLHIVSAKYKINLLKVNYDF